MSKIWTCKIGECDEADLRGPNGEYRGADFPMRMAVREAYREITGRDDSFCFSGWGGELTEPERAVVENREPVRAPDPLAGLREKVEGLRDTRVTSSDSAWEYGYSAAIGDVLALLGGGK